MKTTTIYIGAQPEPKDRLKIEVSEKDNRRLQDSWPHLSNGGIELTDQPSGKTYFVRRRSCGLRNCDCALELAGAE